MVRWMFVVAALVAAGPGAAADDGSWSTSRGFAPAEGALYSEQGNPDVVMENELLELRDVPQGSTRAVFQFHNTSGAPVTVECGFPVDFEFVARPITLDRTGKLVQSSAGENGGSEGETARGGDESGAAEIPGGNGAAEGADDGVAADTAPLAPEGSFAAWDFGDQVPSRYAGDQNASPRGSGFVNSVLSALGLETDPWDARAALEANDEDPDLYYAGTCFRDDQYPRGRRELDAAGLRKLFSFLIQQDGKDVRVSSCVADFGEEPGRVVLHFRHQLSFAAGARSTVTVTYATPTRSEVAGEPTVPAAPIHKRFTWKYVLETASSWKDSLGRIVLSVPAGLEQDPPAPWKYLGTRRGRLYFAAERWRPTAKENLSLEWSSTDIDYLRLWREVRQQVSLDDLPATADPVKLLGASSFLPEKADVFLPWGVLRNAPFDPARLFDGRPETAWAVRTARGGVGEYVRFSVQKSVARLEVANGYQRSTVNFPDKDTWSYFAKNNRVKTLDIVKDTGGLVQRLELADTRELQRFDLSLPPGIYRAVIAAVYPGSRWNDTCLGELVFVPGTLAGFGGLDRDPFFGPMLR